MFRTLAMTLLVAHAAAAPHHRPGCASTRCDRKADIAYRWHHPPRCSTRDVIVRFFVRRHLTREQAAGIAGNTRQESGDDPYAAGGGLIQGQGGRTSSGSLHQQLRGIWSELRGPYSPALGAVRASHSPEAAARAFSDLFEQPSIPAMSSREAFARDAFAHARRRCRE